MRAVLFLFLAGTAWGCPCAVSPVGNPPCQSAWIVYSSKAPGGALTTGICSPSKPIENATGNLAYFRQLPKVPPTAEVRVTALPVVAGVRQEGVTDASGRHVFAGLPPGEYRVEEPERGRPVRVHSKGCAEVPISLRR